MAKKISYHFDVDNLDVEDMFGMYPSSKSHQQILDLIEITLSKEKTLNIA
jgi:hypothetical protein